MIERDDPMTLDEARRFLAKILENERKYAEPVDNRPHRDDKAWGSWYTL